jgi:hypothetical protein
MNKKLVDLISVFSGFITIATAFGLFISPKTAKTLGFSGASLTTIFWVSLAVVCVSGSSSFYQRKIVKKQIQIGGRNNSQNMS